MSYDNSNINIHYNNIFIIVLSFTTNSALEKEVVIINKVTKSTIILYDAINVILQK